MKIFYDGNCPLCRAEMNRLRRKDHRKRLQFEDIKAAEFTKRYPELDMDELNQQIGVRLDDGTWLTGLTGLHAAWKAVGRGWMYAPTRWPIIRPLADWAYRKFAQHRYLISSWLTLS